MRKRPKPKGIIAATGMKRKSPEPSTIGKPRVDTGGHASNGRAAPKTLGKKAVSEPKSPVRIVNRIRGVPRPALTPLLHLQGRVGGNVGPVWQNS